MKKRNWMNKLSNRAMGMMAAMALMVTATTVNQCRKYINLAYEME